MNSETTPSPDSKTASTEPIPLRPHRYPPKIMGALIISVLVFVWAITMMPDYIQAARHYKRGTAAYNDGSAPQAIAHFKKALEIVPSSRKTRIHLAMAYFTLPEPSLRAAGLETLQGVTINQKDWDLLQPVMPAEYRSFFTGEP